MIANPFSGPARPVKIPAGKSLFGALAPDPETPETPKRPKRRAKRGRKQRRRFSQVIKMGAGHG